RIRIRTTIRVTSLSTNPDPDPDSDSGPFHVFAGAGVDLDLFAGLDEEGDLDGNAGLELGRFLDVVGRIPADALRGVGDRQDDTGGEVDGDRLVFDERHGDRGVFHQVTLGLADQFRRQGDRLERLRVGEDEVVPILVTE